MFLIYLQEIKYENQQVVEKCMNYDSCEQECTNVKCELRDIEDFAVSMNIMKTENNDEQAIEHENNSEIQTEIEIKVEESIENNQEIIEDITLNHVCL